MFLKFGKIQIFSVIFNILNTNFKCFFSNKKKVLKKKQKSFENNFQKKFSCFLSKNRFKIFKRKKLKYKQVRST